MVNAPPLPFFSPLFLDKAKTVFYTFTAVKPHYANILADSGASVPLDKPGFGRITVPFMKPYYHLESY
jgi:hypothetical protein